MILENKRILMIEDNPFNVLVLQKALETEGAAVILFLDSKIEGMVDLLPIDIVILDLMMPVMDGFDYFLKIREIPELATIPIVAVSAMDESLAMGRARDLGFNGFISKPVDIDVFPGLILAVINGEKIWNR